MPRTTKSSYHLRLEEHLRMDLRYSSTNLPCLNRVLNKSCKRWSRKDCVCMSPDGHQWRELDHLRVWLTDMGTLVTAEPYGADGESLAGLIDKCTSAGIRVRISSGEWHNGTILLIFTHKEENK